MTAKRQNSGLGRGLSALLQEAPRASDDEKTGKEPDGNGIRNVDIAAIRPNPGQPRRHFSEEGIAELADSIAQRGVLQPILLRAAGGGGYEIVAGERRWRAAQRARLHKIPAIVREFDEASTAEIALIENIQREDLNAIEEADGFRQLIERHGHTQEAVAKLVHKSRSHVANLLRLLDLPAFAKESLVRGDITMGHARAALAAPNPDELVQAIIAEGLSVRQAEVRARKGGGKEDNGGSDDSGGNGSTRGRTDGGAGKDADLAALERQLADLLGLKVTIANQGTKGAVTLHYSSLDQLDMLCQRLSGEAI